LLKGFPTLLALCIAPVYHENMKRRKKWKEKKKKMERKEEKMVSCNRFEEKKEKKKERMSNYVFHLLSKHLNFFFLPSKTK